MDIKISHNWLKEFLNTKSSYKEIGESLSLSGPSVEKISKTGNDFIYEIEVTTNRVDCMSVMGIAREAAAVLPSAKFIDKKETKFKSTINRDLLHIKIDSKLVNRVMAVVMEVSARETPKLIKERLSSAGMRHLNSIVDVTNYVMQETGHPTHVFDYDKIAGKQLVFRPSDKGEKIVAFDGKEYGLAGSDIVIDDGDGIIIDLPGIIGLKNSVVSKETKRIVFFIDNNNPVKIRKTSTRLGIRTMAAILNEKGVDPELATIAFNRGIELYKKICDGKIISKIYDIYPKKYKTKTLSVSHDFIEKIIGVELLSSKVIDNLTKLGFNAKYEKVKKIYNLQIPSWRANDIEIPEDIVEEVARTYGYHNLPSGIMKGALPEPVTNSHFGFENKIKYILKSHGGTEVYTNSLVPKEFVEKGALSLKSPLGDDTKYLRTSLKHSLRAALNENKGEVEPFYLFEVANVYLAKKGDLPNEKMTLGVIFSNYSYRKAKGIVESLYDELNIKEYDFQVERLTDSVNYVELSVEELLSKADEFRKYIPIPKYPAQIEDVTLQFPPKTKVGDVLKEIQTLKLMISRIELVDMYKDFYTFRVWYQDPEKTLDDKDVEKIRNKYLQSVKEKFGGVVKD